MGVAQPTPPRRGQVTIVPREGVVEAPTHPPPSATVQAATPPLKWVLEIRRTFLRTVFSGPFPLAGESLLVATIFLGRRLTGAILGTSTAVATVLRERRLFAAIAGASAAALSLFRGRPLSAAVAGSALVVSLPARGRLVFGTVLGQVLFAASLVRCRLVGPPSATGSTTLAAAAIQVVSLVADEGDNYITDESGHGIILHIS